MSQNETGNNARITPVKLGIDTKFKFECHKNISCFTKCCRGIDIMLTPYDIVRLKNHLELSSEEFLAIYTEPKLLEKTDLPVVTLKLLDDDIKSCPFVRDDGCLVYQNRPTTCRYYPLGVGTLSHKEGADEDEFYFFINEPHCKGFEEEKEWTVREWRKDQGVDIHDKINEGWANLIVLKRSFPQNIKFSEKAKQMFFMGCYNIDKFRKFIFESSFLKMYTIDDETIENIKNDEVALLEFAFSWLRDVFFNKEEKIYKVNENIVEERKKTT
ncbi:MAG: YkgJ family cysteine cluster protein [Proteobacteria bacterium]|nr:YkgJ family cysteine cluster protein [Pseudomonadota bacterium]